MRARSRLEREVDEILKHAGGTLPVNPLPIAIPEPVREIADAVFGWERARLRDVSRLSPVRMVLLSLACIIVGFVLDEMLPYEGYWLSLAGVLLFLPSFAILVFRPGNRVAPRAHTNRPRK